MKQDGSKSRSRRSEENKFLPPPGLELRPLRRPDRGQSALRIFRREYHCTIYYFRTCHDETGESDKNISGFEILTAVTAKGTVSWDVTTPCSPVDHWRFGGTYCHSRRARQENEHQEADSSFLFFEPEDWDGTFLRNVCELLPDYTVPHPRVQNYSNLSRLPVEIRTHYFNKTHSGA
jgi:hypothetical protein